MENVNTAQEFIGGMSVILGFFFIVFGMPVILSKISDWFIIRKVERESRAFHAARAAKAEGGAS